ncbi:PIN domain-containing protein [Flavobacterium sp.]|uniref:PIN domain-containing protein n=1 Tax=Flavobacterium sp. TaxID=239 RepID=UPI00391A92D2
MNIAIDSSILSRDRKLDGFDIRLLKKLSQLKLIQLHIPWIVYQEIISQNFMEADKVLETMSRDLINIDKKGISFKEQIFFKKIATEINEIDVRQSILNHWQEFLDESNAIIHEINDSHGKKVMLSYFEGKSPFPSIKSKKDIPDAFIFEAITSISQSINPLFFVVHDKNLRDSSNKLPNVNAVASYEDLYSLSEFQPLMNKYKEVESYVDELITLEANLPKLTEKVVDFIHDGLFDQRDVFSESIPDDENKATVEEVWIINEIDSDKSKIQYVDSSFYVNFEGTGVFTLEFFVFKSEYYNYSERNIRVIDADWNKHYFLANEDYDFKFSFKCKVDEEDIESFLNYEVEDVLIEVISPSHNHR